jgi:hypothetical protein
MVKQFMREVVPKGWVGLELQNKILEIMIYIGFL